MATKKKKKRLTKRQQKQRKRRIILIVEVVVLLVLLVVLFAYKKLDKVGTQNIGTVEVNPDLDQDIISGYTTIALFGVDNRSVNNYDSGNSDSIMVCCIDNKTKEVKLISVYRDTFLDVDGEGKLYKCNYAYNHGGQKAAIAMLNRNLDLDIQNYVAVDFNGLAEAVDKLGGIELTLTDEEAKIMNDCYIGETAQVTGKEGIPVSGGTQKLDGVQATAYCRIRYTAGDDFKRAERQRTVLKLLVDKAKQSDIATLSSLAESMLGYVSTSYTKAEIIALASDAMKYELVETSGFPMAKATGTFGSKGSVVVPCTLTDNVTALYKVLYDTDDYEPTQTVQDISSSIQSFTGYGAGNAVNYNY